MRRRTGGSGIPSRKERVDLEPMAERHTGGMGAHAEALEKDVAVPAKPAPTTPMFRR